MSKKTEKFIKEADKFYLEGLGKYLNKAGFINEQDEEMEVTSGADADMSDDDMADDEGKDKFDNVDEIMQDIDLSKLKNASRLEMLEIVIDSAQNSDEEKDDFDGFIESVFELVEGYQSDTEPKEEEPEEEPESTEEPPPPPAPEAPAEEPQEEM